jgi:predicted chitinase
MVNPEPTAPRADRVEAFGKTIAKYATIVTVFISAAVPLTEWVRGFSNQKIKEAEQRTTLAVTYLDRIASKETNGADRVMYLGALSKLDGHPLQGWATEQLATEKNELAERKAAARNLEDALNKANAAGSDIAKIQSDIDLTLLKLNQADNKKDVDDLSKTLSDLYAERNKTRTEIVTQANKISTAAATLSQSNQQQTAQSVSDATAKAQDISRLVSLASTITTNLTVTDDLDKLTPEIVKSCWPAVPIDNVNQNLPLIKTALKEYGLTDKPMLIAAMAILRINSERFAPFTETANRFNTRGGTPFDAYENRAALGNTEPGDGAKYIGRGFIGLTGKANYKYFGQQLGIEQELLKNPDIANQPDVAARILASYLKRYSDPMRSALLAGDYARGLRLITGGASDLAMFESMAKCVASKL